MNDALGDRMKLYENIECGRKLIPLLPVLARIDGRAFSSFTRGMNRPYDERMQSAMINTTKFLVAETNACIGYTQSDEITLAWDSPVYFGGRICKIVSQLAAQATLAFNRIIAVTMPEYTERLPTFDARVWQLPNQTEAANVFVWREWDAVKNSITMAASTVYSHKELHGKNSSDKQEMLFAKDINWNDYPTAFKRGTYIQRRSVVRPFTADEIEKLPLKHEARTNPKLSITRNEIQIIDLPIFTTIINKEDVIFSGKFPEISV